MRDSSSSTSSTLVWDNFVNDLVTKENITNNNKKTKTKPTKTIFWIVPSSPLETATGAAVTFGSGFGKLVYAIILSMSSFDNPGKLVITELLYSLNIATALESPDLIKPWLFFIHL